MIRFLIAIPAILSFLMMGAHFTRSGHRELMVMCLAIPFLLIMRRGWSVLVVQLALLAGAALWLWTMWEITQVRAAMGQPAMRMMIILTSVAAWTALSALLLELPACKRPQTN